MRRSTRFTIPIPPHVLPPPLFEHSLDAWQEPFSVFLWILDVNHEPAAGVAPQARDAIDFRVARAAMHPALTHRPSEALAALERTRPLVGRPGSERLHGGLLGRARRKKTGFDKRPRLDLAPEHGARHEAIPVFTRRRTNRHVVGNVGGERNVETRRARIVESKAQCLLHPFE